MQLNGLVPVAALPRLLPAYLSMPEEVSEGLRVHRLVPPGEFPHIAALSPTGANIFVI
jgi:hypothetical protein